MAQTFGKGNHLHLIDGSAFIFRAYHALPPLTRKSDGLPIGAVAGFCNMLFRYVENNRKGDTPTHVAVIFDYFPEQNKTRPILVNNPFAASEDKNFKLT